MSENKQEWDIGIIGEYCITSSGGTPNRSDPLAYGGDIPWVKSGEVASSDIWETEEHITPHGLNFSSAKIAEEGSILVAMYGATAGQVARLKISAATNQAVLAIRPKSSALDSDFLYHFMHRSKDALLKTCQGSGQPNLSAGIISELEINIPPLPEQKKIAEILSGIDVSICLQKNKAEKYQTVITSFRDNLVKQLLRKESTKILPLDNVSRVIDSLHTTPVFTETGIPMVRVTDIKTGVLSLENTKKVTSEAYKLYIKNHEPAEGDIVISRVGSYGITSLNTRNQKFCLGQNTALIHPTSIDGCFLYECLNSSFLRDQVEFMVEGSGYKSLSLASIRSLRIPVPSAIDQCELSSFLKSIQKSLAIEVEYGKKLAIAKNALSADLLSGRMRVSI